MALSTKWASPKEFTAAVLPSSDMNTYVSQLALYLKHRLDRIVVNNDSVVCNNDSVVFNTQED